MKEWRHRSSHHNYTRVRWTPGGLEVSYGAFDFEAQPNENIVYAVELCGSALAEACPVERFLKPVPKWWKPRLRRKKTAAKAKGSR